MKNVPKVRNWEVLDYVRAEGDCLRNYNSVGLHRGWENVLIGSIDKRIEQMREDHLKARIEQLRKPREASKTAA